MTSDDNDTRSIERALLRLDDGTIPPLKCAVLLEITDLGSWLIKFRKTGVIVNNRDIIFGDCIETDATLCFKASSHFWTTINGGINAVEEGLSKGFIKQSGSAPILDLLKRRMIKSSDIGTHLSVQRNQTYAPELQASLPIKQGWLLKKRDIISGWRCRYFVVYIGRLEYFVDQNATQPKGVVSLFDADVQPARKCSVNGNTDHWSITVEPRNKEKIKLASEMTGEEGMVDATSWVQVFMIASKAGSSTSFNFNSTVSHLPIDEDISSGMPASSNVPINLAANANLYVQLEPGGAYSSDMRQISMSISSSPGATSHQTDSGDSSLSSLDQYDDGGSGSILSKLSAIKNKLSEGLSPFLVASVVALIAAYFASDIYGFFSALIIISALGIMIFLASTYLK